MGESRGGTGQVLRVTSDGRAQAGDTVRCPWGELRVVVWVHSAGDVSESLCEQSIAEFKGTPHFTRDSIAGTCALFADGTTGHERQRRRRWVAAQQKAGAA